MITIIGIIPSNSPVLSTILQTLPLRSQLLVSILGRQMPAGFQGAEKPTKAKKSEKIPKKPQINST